MTGLFSFASKQRVVASRILMAIVAGCLFLRGFLESVSISLVGSSDVTVR